MAQSGGLRPRVCTSSPQAPATSAPLIDSLEDSEFHLKHGKDKSLTQKKYYTSHKQYTSDEKVKSEIEANQISNNQLNQASPPKDEKWKIVVNKNWRPYAIKDFQDVEISKENNNDSYKMDNPYGFAIRIEDKLLLYSKDPRLRNIWGNSIGKENKYAKLITDTSARKLFREI